MQAGRSVPGPATQIPVPGAVNAGGAFELIATATAAGSAYAGAVRLVKEAERQKAPFVRLADRYAAI